MITTFGAGFALGLSLILAIGAQNAYVLRTGLRRVHVFWVALTCAVSDAVLIVAGVAGFGWIVSAAPWFAPSMRWGGAAFLIVYGAFAFWRAATVQNALAPAETKAMGLGAAILTTLAFTWLNPHVYLDTVVLLGSVSTRYDDARWIFGAGAVLASFTFFFSLAYGARLLQPLFAKPMAWRFLDAGIGIVMWALAAKLILL